MTHTCCPACRLRIPPAAASGLAACPNCGGDLLAATAADVVGFPLWTPAHEPQASVRAAMDGLR